MPHRSLPVHALIAAALRPDSCPSRSSDPIRAGPLPSSARLQDAPGERFQARERRPGNVCLRRHRCAPQALPGGGSHRGWPGAAEQERGQWDGAVSAADRGSALGDAGGVRGGIRLELAGRSAGRLRLRPTSGAPAAVQGDRFGAAEEQQGRRGYPGAAAARGPAARGVDRPGERPAAPRADPAPDQPGPPGHPAAQPDPRSRRRPRL